MYKMIDDIVAFESFFVNKIKFITQMNLDKLQTD